MTTQYSTTPPKESTSDFEMNSDKSKSELQVHSDAKIIKGELHSAAVIATFLTPDSDNASEHMTMASKDLEVEDPKPFRFMDLPQELRDGIYRELLLPAKVRRDHRSDEKIVHQMPHYAMQLAFLRVCKQTYSESSRVLYKETNWVLVTTTGIREIAIIIRILKKRGYSFTFVHNPLHFPGTPVLRIEMESSLDMYHGHQASMLIPQQDFEIISILFLVHSRAVIALRFDEDVIQNAATRETLLHSCRGFRGTHSVTIKGLGPIDCAKLVNVMTTPIRRFEEFLERATTYQQRADHQLAQGRFLDAFSANQAGHLYVNAQRVGRQRKSPPLTLQEKVELREREVEFLIASAYCRTKAGHMEKARITLDRILTYDNKRLSPTKQQEIKIHYYKALTLVAERDEINAAEEFRVVLSLQPGHQGANEQIDAMEARLQTMPRTKRYEVEAYLKIVMKAYRHRELGDARGSEEEMPVDEISKIVI